jgi:hypothetical protein
MPDDGLLHLREGMTVEDADGDKIGTIKGIVQPAAVVVQATDTTVQSTTVQTGGEVFLKVHSGLPIIGKTLYIPSSAVRDVSGDRVILIADESKVDDMGWDQLPPGIEVD